MTSYRRRRLLLAACAGLAAPAAAYAGMQGKPVIRILLGLPPGGGTDAIARYFADWLPQILEQPVIIESHVGVGGRLAADVLMGAKPDGLTYMIAPNATPTFQTLVFGPQLKWNLWRDFAPVAGLVSYPLGMAVRMDTGVTNVHEYVDWVRKHPGDAVFGTPGLGGMNHFLGMQFAKAAGIALSVAPYKGTPPLINDLVGGHVPAAVTLLDDMLKYHRAGKVRMIGIFSAKRSPLALDIPTMAEQGINVTSGDGWTAMWAPAGTPGTELERMQQALRKILSMPQTTEFLTKRLAVVPDFLDAQDMARRQRAELATWEPIIKASGFKPE